MAKQTVNIGTTPNDGTGDPLRIAFDKLNDNNDEIYGKLISDNFVVVKTSDDFPDAVSGVRTLLANTTYFVTATVDLLGDRFVCQSGTAIGGSSSQNSGIKSTGLVGNPLISSTTSFDVRNITFDHGGQIFSFDGNGTTDNLYFSNCTFLNATTVGVIKDYSSAIIDSCSFITYGGLTINGSIGTLAVTNTLFSISSPLTGIDILSTATITRRFRVIYSSFIVPSGAIGINVNASATIPDEGYILNSVNFSGAGTYLSGLGTTSNKTLFIKCVGIANTAVSGQMYMNANATATTVAATNTFYKAAGTTIASSENQKFTHSSNRLTCDAAVKRRYLVQCTLSFSAGNNNVCKFGFYYSGSASVRTESIATNTANSGGLAENVSFFDIVEMSSGEYIELHVNNTSSVTNITVTEMNLMMTEIQ